VHPGADEARCADGVDHDCDGTDALDVTRCTMPPMTMNTCTDADGDGYGMGFCPGPDCDDSDPTVFPGAIDSSCDDVDSDCDPTGPEVTCNPLPEDVCCDHIDGDGDGRDDPIGAACNCCYDDDGDGHGVGLCASFDCNDGDASIHPGAIDVSCDEIDSDCDPTGPEISCTVPEEHCCDGIDSDGDGQDDPRGVACNCCYDDDG
ncbi:hypothetical protein L6R46_32430, partial [Myxococcota bacterium]|nr:hypothetical protein [Myxococcota bacterium]